jgi:hypothetical protein
MPKRSDGPVSGGYRYGSLSAYRANLPAKAINPRGPVTKWNAPARKALADFAAYPARAKSIGKLLPPTKGISEERAAVVRRIEAGEDDGEYKYIVLKKRVAGH